MATELESLNSSINFHSFESGNTAAISGAVVIPVAVILTTTAGVAVIVVVLAKNNRNTKMKTGQDGREGDYDAVPFPREGTGSFQPSTAAAEDSVVYETV
ncbi:hypothetical protein GBAR_LOCUS18510 [Geodia barretti]|uniref:Uncharacterized protein n=1 Tax=Geodia barretti TaxID=519541 RepID=A0AA35SNN9_GEOBA|nr:hypothetical protein GBAR_LOCUS18510 [Geodia barretti]